MIQDFANLKVLLIGDFMLDHYLIGESIRQSPEAPVPVIIPKEDIYVPGGAGNVAMNLSALGVKIHCIGVVGNDKYGKKIISFLENQGHDASGIEILDNHQTTLKRRILSNSIQVARIDLEKKIDWHPDLNSISLNDFDVCIISDYDKGVVSNINKIDAKTIIIDPKKEDFSFYKYANILTPNLFELKKATHCDINNDSSIITSCQKLINDYKFDFIVAKKGIRGMTIIGKEDFVYNIQALKIDNPDVTGAGDTVIAALSIAYAKTGDIIFASEFANVAAGLVVGKSGTATTSIEEIQKELN